MGKQIEGTNVHILICENNKYLLESYRNLLLYTAESNRFKARIDTYLAEEELLFTIEGEGMQSWDLAILSSQYAKMDGIHLAKLLRMYGFEGEILFLGETKEAVFSAFEAGAFYYWVEKEMTHQKFEEIILNCISHILEKRKNILTLSFDSQELRINVSKVYYLQITHRVVSVFGKDGYMGKFYESMKNLKETLEGKGFVRIHRSNSVNLKYIDKVDKTKVILSNGAELTVGNTYRKELIQSIEKYDEVYIK